MKHLFLPYELALMLKEKGFNEPCLGRYRDKKFQLYSVIKEHCYNSDPISNKDISAPLYQQVIDWFREKHNIMIEVHWQEGTQNYSFCYGYKAGKWFFPKETLNYYPAYSQAIEEALKLI